MLYDRIRTRLLDHATIAQEVGQRIFRLRAPQGTTRPFIRMAQISREAYTAFDGDSGTHRFRYQVDVFGDDPETTARLAAATRAQLSGWSTSNLGAALILELDTIEDQPGSGTGIARVQQDYEIIGDDAAE